MDRDEAARRVFTGRMRDLLPIWIELDSLFENAGLQRDVKTIYVSYTDESGNLVAAVHPNQSGSIEIALPLDPDTSPDLYDAIHLKWRTLPGAVRLDASSRVSKILPLLKTAIQRAGSQSPRPIDDFRRLAQRRTSGE